MGEEIVAGGKFTWPGAANTNTYENSYNSYEHNSAFGAQCVFREIWNGPST